MLQYWTNDVKHKCNDDNKVITDVSVQGYAFKIILMVSDQRYKNPVDYMSACIRQQVIS